MKNIALLTGLLLVTGCATQEELNSRVSSACQIPDASQTKYTHMAPQTRAFPSSKHAVPEKAKAEGVNGCASVEYKIDKHGNPSHVKLLVENPKGFGFGHTAIEQIKGTRFEKPKQANQSYWRINTWILEK